MRGRVDKTLPVNAELLEYRAMLESIALGVVFTRDRRVYRCNQRAAELFGWDPTELVGQPGSVFYPGETAYQALATTAIPILSTGGVLDIEIDLARRDGTRFPARLLARPIDAQQLNAGTVWIAEDLSQIKALRRESERAARIFRLLFERAPTGVLLVRNRTFVHANPHVHELFGWPPGTLVGQSTRVAFESDAAFVAAGRRYAESIARNGSFEGEVSYQRRDGRTIWCRVLGQLVDPEDPAEGQVWMLDDVTEVRYTREMMDRLLQEYALIFDNAMIGISFQRDRTILRCNRRTEEIFGWAPGALTDQSTRVLYSSDADWEEAGLRVYLEIGDSNHFDGEMAYCRKDGTPIWVRIVGRTIADGLSEKTWVWVYDDITEQHQLTEALRRSKAELELRVEERTADLSRLAGQLDYQAHHDPLTGLPNRLLLEDRLRQALQRARRDGRQLALLFVDLDRFKYINDNLGHHVGDQVLNAVATRFIESIRESDTVGRFGGDEFVVVLEHMDDVEAAAAVAGKIIEHVSRPILIDGQELFVGASIGIAFYPRDGEDAPTLLKNADSAMYGAKEHGRNNFQFVSAEINEAAMNRFRLEAELRRALERDELTIFLQPQFSLADGRLCGAEALIRWQHPQRGLIAPGLFIPLLEETGLIVPAGQWLVRTVCQHWARWSGGRHDFPLAAINVSGVEFRRGDLEASVRAALADSGLAPSLLELEITESALMHQADGGVAVLERLRQLGVRIAVDDFGTGYSSLAYLKRLPLHKLKIDRSFVQGLPDDGEDATLSRTIISLAHNLRLEVIAEGVETEAQRDFLTAEGCDQMQGFLTGRPVPVEEFHQRFLA